MAVLAEGPDDELRRAFSHKAEGFRAFSVPLTMPPECRGRQFCGIRSTLDGLRGRGAVTSC